MSTSPLARCGASASLVSSTGLPEGTMIQITRGAERRAQRSRRSTAPFAPCPALAFTASALRSHTTTSWPPLSRRSVMFPSIRPRPIMASCMVGPFSSGRRRRCAEQADIGAHDDVHRYALEQLGHAPLAPEGRHEGAVLELRHNPGGDAARKVHSAGGEDGQSETTRFGPERGGEEVERLDRRWIGGGEGSLRDRAGVVAPSGERLVNRREARTGNDPLAGDVLIALREEGMQRE